MELFRFVCTKHFDVEFNYRHFSQFPVALRDLKRIRLEFATCFSAGAMLVIG
jgi:hypothetical protein